MKQRRMYFGKEFLERKDKYWVCSTNAALYAHRWVWINNFGEIPPGMEIHHIDHNKGNNDIENLRLISASNHLKHHWRERKYNPHQLLLSI